MISRSTGIKIGVAMLAIPVVVSASAFMGKPATYRCAGVESGSVARVVAETGDIHGEETRTYYAAVSAPVKNIGIEVGDVVTKGEKLAEYDDTDFVHNLTQATLGKEQAEVSVQGQIDKSNSNYAKYKAATKDDAIYSQLYAAERESTQALTENQYAEDYYTNCAYEGITTKIAQKQEEITKKGQELSKQKTKVANAGEYATKKMKNKQKDLQNEYNELQNELTALQTELTYQHVDGYTPAENEVINDHKNVMEDITRNWEEAKTNKLNYESSYLNENEKAALMKDIDKADEVVAVASEELTKAQAGVVSDFSGVVTERLVESDAFVQEGAPLFSVESTDEVKAVINVSRYDIGSIKVGQKASVDIAGKKYEAEVSEIEHLATKDSGDKSKVEVSVHIFNPDENVILGIESDVTVYTEEIEDAAKIPFAAYYTDDGGSCCYCIENGVVTKKYFTPGIVGEDYVEVIDGLTGSERVIVDAVTDEQVGKKAEEG